MPSRLDDQLLDQQGITYDLAENDAWRAWKRIGVRPESIVQWGFGLLNQWPESDSTWLALRQEIGALGCLSWCGPVEHWADHIQKKLTVREEVSAIFRLPVQKEASRFLLMLKGCIEDLLNGSIARVGPLSVSISITRRDRKVGSRSPRPKHEVLRPHQLTDEAIYKVLQALDVCGGLVNRCPECNALFLAERSNRMYCGLQCQNVVTSRRFREKQKAERPKRKKKRTTSRRGSAGA